MKPGRKSTMQQRTVIAGILITVWQDVHDTLQERNWNLTPTRLEIEDVEGQMRGTWNFTYKQTAMETMRWVVRTISADIITKDDQKVSIREVLDMIGREMPLVDPLFGE